MARPQIDKNKRKSCNFCADKVEVIDYKDAQKIRRYLTEAGKILPRRITGTCAEHQRMLAKAVKKAKVIAYDDLGTEAIRKLTVENFPAIVVIDSEGNNLYETAIKEYRKVEE